MEPDSDRFPFHEWDGEWTQHVAVSPTETAYAIPSGAHERLHALIIGDNDIVGRTGGPPQGTKVELALVGWVQLQSDSLTDRINVDAPDGFSNVGVLRRFASVHDAESASLAFFPSGDTLKLTAPQQASFDRNGPRVPVHLDSSR